MEGNKEIINVKKSNIKADFLSGKSFLSMALIVL